MKCLHAATMQYLLVSCNTQARGLGEEKEKGKGGRGGGGGASKVLVHAVAGRVDESLTFVESVTFVAGLICWADRRLYSKVDRFSCWCSRRIPGL